MTINTAAVEQSVNKNYYKLLLKFLRILPMLLAIFNCLNAYLSMFGYEIPALSYLGGISFTGWLFIYLTAIVFRFCIYHRLFLYYVLINNILSIYEYHIGIPVDDASLIRLYSIFTAIFLFLILYFHRKERLCGK